MNLINKNIFECCLGVHKWVWKTVESTLRPGSYNIVRTCHFCGKEEFVASVRNLDVAMKITKSQNFRNANDEPKN